MQESHDNVCVVFLVPVRDGASSEVPLTDLVSFSEQQCAHILCR